jgi:hypothetical protein
VGSVNEAAIIGAGPFGLAAAAHLRAAGIATVVAGSPMAFWKRNMPRGMYLRSRWRGSHIADPGRGLTLDHFASSQAQPRTEPIPIAMFIRYGEWFQTQVIPDLETRMVTGVKPSISGFRLILDDGEPILARRVIVATGLIGHSYRPPQFAGLPIALASHSSEHSDLACFQGRRVAVVGTGQSALESAAILLDHGAEVELIARARAINWIDRNFASRDGARGPTAKRIADWLTPPSQVGPFPLNWIFEMQPLMRCLPPGLRRLIATCGLRPSALGRLIPRLEGLRFHAGRVVLSARRSGDQVCLQLDNCTRLSVDHVVLATGYRIGMNHYSFLSPELIAGVASTNGSPELSGDLESSVPGLHFVGAAAVSSFGPIMRFVWGAGFASRRLATCIRSRNRVAPAPTFDLQGDEAMLETATSQSVLGAESWQS